MSNDISKNMADMEAKRLYIDIMKAAGHGTAVIVSSDELRRALASEGTHSEPTDKPYTGPAVTLDGDHRFVEGARVIGTVAGVSMLDADGPGESRPA